MIVTIGTVFVKSLYAIAAGNYKLELSIDAKHYYGYRRDGEGPERVDLTLRVAAAEAVEWLPIVGLTVPCDLVSTGPAGLGPVDAPRGPTK